MAALASWRAGAPPSRPHALPCRRRRQKDCHAPIWRPRSSFYVCRYLSGRNTMSLCPIRENIGGAARPPGHPLLRRGKAVSAIVSPLRQRQSRSTASLGIGPGPRPICKRSRPSYRSSACSSSLLPAEADDPFHALLQSFIGRKPECGPAVEASTVRQEDRIERTINAKRTSSVRAEHDASRVCVILPSYSKSTCPGHSARGACSSHRSGTVQD